MPVLDQSRINNFGKVEFRSAIARPRYDIAIFLNTLITKDITRDVVATCPKYDELLIDHEANFVTYKVKLYRLMLSKTCIQCMVGNIHDSTIIKMSKLLGSRQ
ncbi:unnamed protein product [Ambrosiozyma monospora]|uniref:Unnamed protein product n=1 Tax=Ambrosiozyma monospora TaxID=43982 RepID=A0ACB5SZ17_AMBMO|nr:unnamed protein product [Ambrosiozyma monospora]